MPKRKLKTHIHDQGNWTLCGKVIDDVTGSPLNQDGSVHSARIVSSLQQVTCRTCLKASATPKGRKALARSA